MELYSRIWKRSRTCIQEWSKDLVKNGKAACALLLKSMNPNVQNVQKKNES